MKLSLKVILTLLFALSIASCQDDGSSPGQKEPIIVESLAQNDVASFNKSQGVISGNLLQNDDLSSGSNHRVSQIQFGSERLVNVSGSASVTIEGDHGILTIFENGDFSYSLNANATELESSLNPVSELLKVEGDSSYIQNGGITIYSLTQKVNWFADKQMGLGYGIGTSQDAVYGRFSTFSPDELIVYVDEDGGAEAVTIQLADISNLESNSGVDFLLQFADGSDANYEFDLSEISTLNGIAQIELRADMFDNRNIEQFFIYSISTNSDLESLSFTIHNIMQSTSTSQNIIRDRFIYKLTTDSQESDYGFLDIEAR
tara:strand:+ start:462 stop:1412 length:951 start_codon:yes stop_codon:yes gene_type:complete